MKRLILISYPRSGAHWLRTLIGLHSLELLGKMVHTHDNFHQLSFQEMSDGTAVNPTDPHAAEAFNSGEAIVCYCYRDPLSVMFSMAEYYRPIDNLLGLDFFAIPRHWPKEPIVLDQRIPFWMEMWNKHVERWTQGPESKFVDVYIRYPDLPLGARALLQRAGVTPSEEKLSVSRDVVKEFVMEHTPPAGPRHWFDKMRFLEERDSGWADRKEQFQKTFRLAIEKFARVDAQALPQTQP